MYFEVEQRASTMILYNIKWVWSDCKLQIEINKDQALNSAEKWGSKSQVKERSTLSRVNHAEMYHVLHWRMSENNK